MERKEIVFVLKGEPPFTEIFRFRWHSLHSALRGDDWVFITTKGRKVSAKEHEIYMEPKLDLQDFLVYDRQVRLEDTRGEEYVHLTNQFLYN